MAKPAIALRAPPALFVGQQHTIEVELEPEADMKVDFVEARMWGRQGWEIGSGKHQVTHRVAFPKLVSRFMDRGILPAKKNRFAIQLTVPPGVAPTHQIDPAYAYFEIQVRIGVPWWFDVKYRYLLPVRVPPPTVVQRTPLAIRSTPANAAADRPRIEIGLGSTRLVAGEVVAGSCAVFHLDDRKPREVDLSLVPVLRLLGRGRPRDRAGNGFGMTLTMPAGSAGTSIPFAIQLPMTMTPSFRSVSHELGWRLVARSGSFFRGKVELAVPIEIVDRAAAATTEQITEAPRLADERVAALFATFAGREGWSRRMHRNDADDDGQIVVEREHGDCELRLGYAYRDDGTFVIGRITNPGLGLGLSVSPSSSIRHVFWKDIEVDIDVWDRAHYVAARFADQAIPMLRAVVPTLLQFPELGTLVRWTDDELVFEHGVAAVEGTSLMSSGAALEQVASALDAARASIPPPPGIEVDLDDMRELARWLGGQLAVGDLSITGKLGHVPVELGLEFDEELRPIGVRAAVGNPDDASANARAIALALPHPASDALGAGVAESLVDLLTRWPTDVVDLHVVDGIASARLAIEPIEVGTPKLEVRRVRELVQGLVALLAALDPGAGPYR